MASTVEIREISSPRIGRIFGQGAKRVMAILVRRDSAVKLIDGLAGESPASADCPVGTVVISGDGAGDQTVGSPDVNVLDGWRQVWSAPTGGLAKQQGAPAQTGEVQ
jgi:hypothetical protein